MLRIPDYPKCLLYSCLFWMAALCHADVANVNEGLVTTHRYVDAANNSGTEDGSAAHPWNTVGEGFAWLNANGSTHAKLHIADGIYREGSLALSSRSGVAVIEGESRGGVVLSGSDVWTGWTADGSGNWYQTWTNDWGLGSINYANDPESDLGRRSEMVFQDGVLLRQVLSLGEMADGTYYVDEAADRLYLRPAHAADPAAVTLEVAVRKQIFFMYANDDVVFRRLTFQHTASGADSSASTRAFFIGGEQDDGGNLEDPEYNGQPINSPPDRDYVENILIEDCIFQWNNGGGASINNAKYLTIRNSSFRYNGSAGLGATRLQHVEYVDSQFNYNNWRKGILGGLYGWAPAGTKTLFADQLVIRGCDFIGNQTAGLWMDFGSSNVTVFDSLMMHNWSQGFYNEANYGPVNASALLVRNNGWWPKDDGDPSGGIYFAESRAFSVSNSYVIDNSYFGLGYRNSTRTSTAYWSGSTHTEVDTFDGISREMNFFQNTVVASRRESWSNWTTEAQKNGNVIGLDSGGTTGWRTESVPTYSGDYNTYYSPHTSAIFTDKEDTTYGFDEVDLAGWQGDTGQELNSTWDANWQDGLDFDAYQESGGLVVFEAENYHSNDKGADTEPWQMGHGLWSGALGNSGSGYLAPPVNAVIGDSATAARLSYRIFIETPGTYHLAVRRLAPTTSDDSVHVSIDGNLVGNSISMLWGAAATWTWKRAETSLGFLDAGLHTLEIVRREDGFLIDRIAIADDLAKLPAEGLTAIGPEDSAHGRPAQSDSPITLTALKTTVFESEGQAVFRFSRTGIDGALTVNYSTGGNAVAGVDYTTPAGSVTIPDGANFADVVVVILDDGVAEEAKTLTLTIQSGAGYTAGTPAAATVTQPANGLLAYTQASLSQPTGTTQSFTLEVHNPFATTITYTLQDPDDLPGEYLWVPEPYVWTNIAQSGNAVTDLDNHDGTETVQISNLPNGNFKYMGYFSTNRFFISSNGLLTFYFNKTFGGVNKPMPTQDISEMTIAGFWDDLQTQTTGTAAGRIYQADSGDRHIVQFEQVNNKGGGTVTFQMVLDYNGVSSDDDEVVLYYKDVATAGISHTIAAQSYINVPSGGIDFGGARYAFNEAKVTDLSGIRLIKAPAWFSSTHVGTTLTIPAGETATLTFDIDTTGLPTGTQISREFLLTPDRSDVEEVPLTLDLTVEPSSGAVAFDNADLTVVEDDGTAVLSVTRSLGTQGAISIDYATVDGSAQNSVHYSAASGTLSWADGESGSKQITVPLINVAAIEPATQFTVRLSQPTGGILSPAPLTASVTISDSAVNTAPTITLNSPVGAAATVSDTTQNLFLDLSASDDGIPQALSYAWSQVSGPGTASFDDAASGATSVIFDTLGQYVLRLSVTDGALQDTQDITVDVGAPLLVPPTDNRHVYFPFDESSGTEVTDPSTSVSSFISNISGGTWGAGQVNNAYFFPGSQYHYMDTPSGLSVNDSPGIAMAAWIRLDSAPGTTTGYILAENRGSSADIRTWMAVDSSRRLYTKIGNSTTQSATAAITVGQWHHVAMTAGAGTVKLYIDGVEAASRSETVETLASTTLRIANGNSIGTSTAWHGGLDELYLYTRKLTLQEVGILAGTAVFDGNYAPLPQAGPAQSTRFGGSIFLAGSATDDGLPNPPATLSYTWSQLSGPTTAVIADPANPLSAVTLPSKGDYHFRFVASDGQSASAAYVTHTASGDPADLVVSHSSGRTAQLNWTDASGETSYRVWMRVNGASEWTLAASELAADSTGYTINGLTRGAAYEFSVEAMDGTTPRDSSEVSLTLREGFIQEATSPHLVVIEAEDRTSTSSNGSADSWTETLAYSGYSGDAALELGPDSSNNWTSNVPAIAPYLAYQIDFATSGTHYVLLRCREPAVSGSGGDSFHVGINGALPTTGDSVQRAGDANGYTIGTNWVWAGKLSDYSRASVEVPSAGVHTIYIWGREDGLIVDKLIITSDINYFPEPGYGVGPTELSAGQPAEGSVIEQWRDANWQVTTATGDAADTANPDLDALNNFQEFALGANPLVADDPHYLPIHALKEDNGNSYLEFKYRRRLGAATGTTETGFMVDGVTYTVEVSGDLSFASWQTGTSQLEQVGAPVYNGDGTESVTVRVKAPVGDTDRRFVRLRIE